jgi:hypothetical protein
MSYLSKIEWLEGNRRLRALRSREESRACQVPGVYRYAQRQLRARRAARKRRRGWA